MQKKTKNLDYGAIRDELTELIANNRLLLPGVPEAAHRVRQAAMQADIDLAEVADLAAQDPPLAAHLIKISNSVAIRGGHEIHNLRAAVTRLGARLTAVSATSFAILQMVAMAPRHVDRLRALYQHATEVGERCYLHAHRYSHLSPEDALLTGLVHNIGTAVVLQYVRGKPRLQLPAVLEALIEEVQATAGAELLRLWKFPSQISAAVASHEDWYRGKPADAPDYADLLIAAKAEIYQGTAHPLAALAKEPLPVFVRLQLDLSSPSAPPKLTEDAVTDMPAFFGLATAS